jgi:hypothetical protein
LQGRHGDGSADVVGENWREERRSTGGGGVFGIFFTASLFRIFFTAERIGRERTSPSHNANNPSRHPRFA